MARIRKGVSYRHLERAYTRVSKFRKKGFIKSNPALAIVKFDMGDKEEMFDTRLDLVAKTEFQGRHNALESARQTSNRVLEKELGKSGYHFKMRPYPHHILRENPLASGAGADRLSTGMQASFGKPIGKAARIMGGQIVASVYLNENNLQVGKRALKRASYKFPVSFAIKAVKLK